MEDEKRCATVVIQNQKIKAAVPKREEMNRIGIASMITGKV